jgi:PAS domain S-box-containing protein
MSRLVQLGVISAVITWAGGAAYRHRWRAVGQSLESVRLRRVAEEATQEARQQAAHAEAAALEAEVATQEASEALAALMEAEAALRAREQAQAQLHENTARFAALVASSRDAIIGKTLDGTITSWNPAAEQIFGYSAPEIVGQSVFQLVPEELHAGERDLLERVSRGEPVAIAEVERLRKDGQRIWISLSVSPVRDPSGRIIGAASIKRDITEHRLAEERLRDSQRLRAVGQLAGGVAHEANNQMSVVIGATEFILQRPDLPEAIRVDVEHIRRAADRTAAVTAQLLAFSRRQLLKPQVLNLSDLVRRFETVLQRVMGEDCTISLRLASTPVRVKADPGQLEQVLLNLALNARDAMPRGGVFTVETLSTEVTGSSPDFPPGVVIQAGHYALLLVSDTGHGMDRATLGHIFEPFFTTKGVGQGTGLGLSTVYGIVKQSDGYVWATSEPGSGTIFKIYLPLTAEEIDAPRPSGAVRLAATGELILVVEDEEMVRRMAARALTEGGYRVLEAGSAREALDLLANATGPCKLVLMDVVMPGMGGRELASRIEDLWPGIPVLFISGHTDGEILSRGLLDPDTAFLAKPFTVEALVRAVRDRLQGPAPAHVGKYS